MTDGGTDTARWPVSEPVEIPDYIPLDMATNITDRRVRDRIAWVDGCGRAYADAIGSTSPPREPSETEVLDISVYANTDGYRAVEQDGTEGFGLTPAAAVDELEANYGHSWHGDV